MLRVIAFLAFLSVVGALVPIWLLLDGHSSSRSLSGLQGDPEKGAYLARLAGCVACHTDISGGGAFLGGGPAITTDYGTFFAPNITSDVNFGIGAWTPDQFADALVDGRAPDGHRYYPVFPYTVYSALSDQDIVDLWAALRTTTPAQTKAQAHRLRFPVVSRELLGPWKKLTAFMTPVVQDSTRSPAWNRGAFIATGPGLCSQCHSPRNLLGAVASGSPLAGVASGSGRAGGPLTPDVLKQRGWTVETLKTALRTGRTPNGRSFESPMLDFVQASTAHYTDGDSDALVEYLMSQ